MFMHGGIRFLYYLSEEHLVKYSYLFNNNKNSFSVHSLLLLKCHKHSQ